MAKKKTTKPKSKSKGSRGPKKPPTRSGQKKSGGGDVIIDPSANQ